MLTIVGGFGGNDTQREMFSNLFPCSLALSLPSSPSHTQLLQDHELLD